MSSQAWSTWGRRARTPLWILVILSLLLSLPMIYGRMQTESSANNVEIVYDYNDLVQMSDYAPDPDAFMTDAMNRLKAAGVTSLAVYESSLAQLQQQREVKLFTSSEMAPLTKQVKLDGKDETYVVFTSKQAAGALTPIITQAFQALGLQAQSWSFQGQPGLVIPAPVAFTSSQQMDPDPLTLQQIHDHGFRIVPRLSNNRPFDPAAMDKLLSHLSALGVKDIVFAGDAVTGYNDNPKKHTLQTMATLMNKYGIGTANIEQPLSKQLKGFNQLAAALKYNVVRLHPIASNESGEPPVTLADRMVLAVKERNIRMIYLHGAETKDPINDRLTNTLDNMTKALNGPDGSVPRIKHFGFKIGHAEPFTYHTSAWHKDIKLVLVIGAAALGALTAAEYFPALTVPIFVLALIGSAGLYVESSSLLLKAMALLAGICAPTYGVIRAIRSVTRRNRAAAAGEAGGGRLGFAAWMLIRSSLFSMMGVLLIIGMLNNIKFFLLLEQFRGVSLLHLAPIGLIAIYLLFFGEANTWQDAVRRIRAVLLFNLNILIVLAGIVALGIIWYYLSRTGNAGQASSLEKAFRAFLENTLVVRPRTKELLCHPFLVLAAYYGVKHRGAVYMFIAAVIAQLSIDDTFAHLHTPVHISLIRVAYGVGFGLIIGLVLIAICQLIARGYRQWATPLAK